MRKAGKEMPRQRHADQRRHHHRRPPTPVQQQRESAFANGSRQPHCAEATAHRIILPGTTIQRRIHSSSVIQLHRCA